MPITEIILKAKHKTKTQRRILKMKNTFRKAIATGLLLALTSSFAAWLHAPAARLP